MTRDAPIDRRRFLTGSLAVALSAGLAGCESLPFLGDDGANHEPSTDPTPGGSGDGGPSGQMADRDLVSIAVGLTREGHVEEGDGRDPLYDDLVEPVALRVAEPTTVEITMQSDAFDAYLIVGNPSGSPIAEDNDGGSGTNSQVAVELSEPGTYTIWAGSLAGDATGPYTLSVSETSATPENDGDGGTDAATATESPTDAGDGDSGGDGDTGGDGGSGDGGGGSEDLRSIAVGESRQGTIDAGDEQEPFYGKLAEPVELSVDAERTLTIELTSNAVDTYLILADDAGNMVAENDDIAYPDNLNSRITTGVSAGSYTIWATTYSGDETGPYTLSVSRS